MSNTRSYTDNTLKRLYGMSGNQCSFPECTQKLTNAKNALDSNVCHIEAHSPRGERYNPNMTNKERNDYPNLIVLCPQHHSETNDVDKYTVEILKTMKQKHEMEVVEKMSSQKKISAIAKIVSKIAEIDIDEIKGSETLFSFKPEEKIKFNNIKIYKPLFEEYRVYSSQLNTIYNEMDEEGSLKKKIILQNIKSIYLMIKGELNINSQEDIESQADKIIEKVQNQLLNKLADNNLDEESKGFAVEVILVDAFMRCKILEEPK
jgi:hypothetical protein